MELRKKKLGCLYDLWTNESKKSNKLHPSIKRGKKNPLPHPGQSYNPDPKDHQRLLQKIAKDELKFQHKQNLIKAAVQVKINEKEVLKNDKEELLSGIKHLVGEDEDSGSDTDCAYEGYDEKDFEAISKDKRVKEKRKSRQQRLRQMKDKLQRKAAKLRKLKNIRSSKFDALKRMVKELDKKQKEELAKQLKKTHKKIKNERLGQKFEKSDPLYCLSDELPSNLRQAGCPMGSIVREQLESFQSRLMVEPTMPQVKQRKYKRRTFERKAAAEEEG